jgi:cobalt/nickel transport protein
MRPRVPTRALILVGLAVALLIAGGLSYVASRDPDGLTKVSEDQGFASSGRTHDGLLVAGGLSAVLGALVVLALAGGLTYLLRRRRASESAGHERESV